MFRFILLFITLSHGLIICVQYSSANDNAILKNKQQKLFYQFDQKYTHTKANARIEYINNGEVFHQQSQPINPDQQNIVTLPDPAALSVAFYKSGVFKILVYINDKLIDELTFNQLMSTPLNQIKDINTQNVKNTNCIPTPDDPCLENIYECNNMQSDCDEDGIITRYDNCHRVYNPSQADCDNDGIGDACDTLKGIYVKSGSEQTCLIDKDVHFIGTFSLEHYVKQRWIDTTQCRSPDRFTRRGVGDAFCFNLGTTECCDDHLTDSIHSFGDNANNWCRMINQNHCN